MNKQLLKLAHESWLKGYDIRVIYKMHERIIEIGYGKKKNQKFTNFAKAFTYLTALLQFAEPDKAVGAQRQAEAETSVEPAGEPEYAPAE